MDAEKNELFFKVKSARVKRWLGGFIIVDTKFTLRGLAKLHCGSEGEIMATTR